MMTSSILVAALTFTLVTLCSELMTCTAQLWEHETSTILYPYGPGHGDGELNLCDDCSSNPIDIPVTFPFFNDAYNRFWINANGMISFRHPIHVWIPRAFPVNFPRGMRSIIAPYWSDVDVRRTVVSPDGMIYHREITNPSLLQTAADDIQRVFGTQYRHFEASWGYIVTWHQVTHAGASVHRPAEMNTFQVVLLTDGEWSFAMFHYGDMQWSVGRYSNGKHAQVGYDTGDGDHFSVDNSGTADITEIEGSYYMRMDVDVPSSSECTIDGGVRSRVRLTYGGHGNVMQGNAEIRVNGEWHSICDRGWGDEDATVFCTQLGFPGPATAYRNAHFAVGGKPFAMDRVRCAGDERCILNCTHRADPDPTLCFPGDEAGAVCAGAPVNEMRIRLSGSVDPREGNVEVKYEGQFVRVCDDGWGEEEAEVVCNELGYSGGHPTRRAFFGVRDHLDFGMERVQCDGSEDTLSACEWAPAGGDCADGNEAGVVCFGAEHPIRLYDGSPFGETSGQVEILIGTKYHKVCDAGWGQVEADIVCQELGFTGPATAHRGSPHGHRNSLNFFTFRCDGTESKLYDCLRPLAGNDCDGGAAAVTCSE